MGAVQLELVFEAKKERTCVDCPVSLRNTHAKTKRCVTCVAVHKKKQKKKDWEKHRERRLAQMHDRYMSSAEVRASQRARAKKHLDANRDKINAGLRARRKANPELTRQKDREWRVRNPEAFAAICRKYYKNNREKILARGAQWRKDHAEQDRANRKKAA